ncbi:DUF892 family protein [Mucilaginibacter kameinonensis]|uniref:DUF892 family protein n=1 Tax=Mucilaginibacter kameinonensis TaxID=452286 RepID=UPI001FC97050|nr:DUF892 family protein [Mucilaginibacter kameinonensis]
MKMITTGPEAAQAFEKHMAENDGHITILNEVFGLPYEKPADENYDAMTSILEEANGIVRETEKGTMIGGFGLIPEAQKVEHPEVVTYGKFRRLATDMGRDHVAALLQKTLYNKTRLTKR